MNIEDARGIAAQAWCEPPNTRKEMDVELGEAFAASLVEQIAVERRRCADIVRAAREGDIDGDLRSIIFRIESGNPFPETE